MEQNPLPSPPPPGLQLYCRGLRLSTQFHASLPLLLLFPQPNAFPIVPVFPQPPHSSRPNSGATLPPCSFFPRAPSSCSSLHVLLALHLCLPSACGLASWRIAVEHIRPCTLPPWARPGGSAPYGHPINICGLNLKGFRKDNLQSIESGHFQTNGSVLLGGWRPLGGSSLPLIADSPPPPQVGEDFAPSFPQTSILSLPLSSC